MNCERCGHPHSRAEWDELFTDWRVFFITKKGFGGQKAFLAAHKEMRKHGPRPEGPKGPPWWAKFGARKIGGGEAVEMLKKIWAWLNGKKTLIASILVGIPVIWDVLDDILVAGGMNPEQVVSIGAVLLLVVGWAHKILKALGVAKEPEKK